MENVAAGRFAPMRIISDKAQHVWGVGMVAACYFLLTGYGRSSSNPV
jgi:hypothetical protein